MCVCVCLLLPNIRVLIEFLDLALCLILSFRFYIQCNFLAFIQQGLRLMESCLRIVAVLASLKACRSSTGSMGGSTAAAKDDVGGWFLLFF